MKFSGKNYLIVLGLGLAVTAWFAGTQKEPILSDLLVSTAEARRGRPATPVSYAGVARRTTVRVATPGVGAPGVGVRPGAGAGRAGVGVNAGGPVNRVGVR